MNVRRMSPWRLSCAAFFCIALRYMPSFLAIRNAVIALGFNFLLFRFRLCSILEPMTVLCNATEVSLERCLVFVTNCSELSEEVNRRWTRCLFAAVFCWSLLLLALKYDSYGQRWVGLSRKIILRVLSILSMESSPRVPPDIDLNQQIFTEFHDRDSVFLQQTSWCFFLGCCSANMASARHIDHCKRDPTVSLTFECGWSILQQEERDIKTAQKACEFIAWNVLHAFCCTMEVVPWR